MKNPNTVRRVEYCAGCGKVLTIKTFTTGHNWVTPIASYLNSRSGCCNDYVVSITEVVPTKVAFSPNTYETFLKVRVATILRDENIAAEKGSDTPSISPPDPTPRDPVQPSETGEAPLFRRLRAVLTDSTYRTNRPSGVWTSAEVDELFEAIKKDR